MKDAFDNPIPLAFLACDNIITDAHTGKKSLINLFNAIGAARFPHVIPQFFIFASFTNYDGEADVKIRLQAANGDIVCTLPGKVPFKTPLDAPEMIFAIQNLVIKTSGTYEMQLLVDDNQIATRLMTFKQIQMPPNAQPQPPQQPNE